MAILGSKGLPHPRGGKVALSAEEGMIRNITNCVMSDGIGVFDAELGDFHAAGQIISQVYPADTSGSHTSPSEEHPELKGARFSRQNTSINTPRYCGPQHSGHCGPFNKNKG